MPPPESSILRVERGRDMEEILKSDRLYNKAWNFTKAFFVLSGAAVASALGMLVGNGVYSAKIDNLKSEVETTTQYQEYVETKIAEYDEKLYGKEITPEDYIAKVNDLKDIDAYLKSDASTYEMVKYAEFEGARNACIDSFMGVSLTFLGGALAMGISAITLEKLSEKAEREEEME